MLRSMARPRLTIVDDARVCEWCGKTFHRADLKSPINGAYWARRRFCDKTCSNASNSTLGSAQAHRKVTATGKICGGCGEDKPLDQYSPNRAALLGRQSRCKQCNVSAITARRKHLKATLPPEEYTALRRREILLKACVTPERFEADCAAQDGCCAICQREAVLVPDHDHQQKKYRAPLCFRCNCALGLMKEDATAARSMADYIEKHR